MGGAQKKHQVLSHSLTRTTVILPRTRVRAPLVTTYFFIINCLHDDDDEEGERVLDVEFCHCRRAKLLRPANHKCLSSMVEI